MLELDIKFPKNILKQNVPKLAPWIQPKITFCFHMESFPKKETSQTEIQAQFYRHKHETNIDIYTDGSKTGHESVGAGIAIMHEANKAHSTFHTKNIKLCNKSTILSAELEAIKTGLANLSGQKNTTLTVYSDSKGALQSLMQYDPKHPLAKEIQSQLSRLYVGGHSICIR